MVAYACLEELEAFLKRNRVPVHRWDGKTSKTLTELWQEIKEGETKLIFSHGQYVRHLKVSSLFISHVDLPNRLQLWEIEETTKTGTRSRKTRPGGKVKIGETPCQAAKREAQEELGLTIKQNHFRQRAKYHQVWRNHTFCGLPTLIYVYEFKVPAVDSLPTTRFARTYEDGNTSVFEWL